MKKMMSKLVVWFRKAQHKAKMAKIVERENRIIKEAKQAIQITEYNGTLYICYNNFPFLPITMLKEGVNDTLRTAREMYVEHNLNNNENNI